MGKCEWPICSSDSLTGKKFCFMHGRVYENSTTTKKERKPIPKKSVKAKKEDKEYIKFVKGYLSRPENKFCAIQGPNCTTDATCINHLKRRFKSTKMNEEFVEPSCSNCNSDIENKDKEARETGHLLSKYL